MPNPIGQVGSRSQLLQLARLYNVQTVYSDVSGRRRHAMPEALLHVLQALGAPVETLRDVPTALRERQQELWQQVCSPVSVVWDGAVSSLELRLPADLQAQHVLDYSIVLENGEEQHWSVRVGQTSIVEQKTVEGRPYVVRQFQLPERLPFGFHTFRLEGVGEGRESLLLSAPQKAYGLPQKCWGVFLPLYALHSHTSWGGGDFSDLDKLVEWTAKQGGSVVATLPLLASFLGVPDEPFDPSPYAPASRLFWNEFYIDVSRIPELTSCQTARTLLKSTDVQTEIAALQKSSLVDYRRQIALKRQVLEALAHHFFAEPSVRQTAFADFVESHPRLEDYARFRAAGERFHTPWPEWPQPLRDGLLTDDDVPKDLKRYHLYVQWIAHEQMQAVAEKARRHGPGLYLDLPLGVHRFGYDVWHERDIFATDVSCGAPPDSFFPGGQDWGFPPLQPEKSRAQGYRYVRAYLRQHLQQAGVLRVDHVMGLHRLFWIPKGRDTSQGVYVRYPAEELYAILSIESQRNNVCIIGEDLGIVPSYVRPAMVRHGIQRMHVLQYALPTQPDRQLQRVPAHSVASVNTHDMAPFAAFWQGLEQQERIELGLLDSVDVRQLEQEYERREQALLAVLTKKGWLQGQAQVVDLQTLYTACVSYLAASSAPLVLVSLEDVWAETQRQNMPGTGEEQDNWRRKARYSFETFSQMSEVFEVLRLINVLRKKDSAGLPVSD